MYNFPDANIMKTCACNNLEVIELHEYLSVQLNSTQIWCLLPILYDIKYKDVLKSNWILILKFILLHRFQNIL
jgi:hypothetical protein